MITPEQCRSARAWLDWSQEELAAKASVALSTVRDFEKGRRIPIANNIAAIEGALAAAGMFPLSSDGEPAGVRFQPRIRERETYLPALQLLSDAPEGFMTTSELIRELEAHFEPSGDNAEILEGRADTRFSQIIRNIVSHRETPGNPLKEGWADYDKGLRGLRITPAGRRHLAAETKAPKTSP